MFKRICFFLFQSPEGTLSDLSALNKTVVDAKP